MIATVLTLSLARTVQAEGPMPDAMIGGSGSCDWTNLWCAIAVLLAVSVAVGA